MSDGPGGALRRSPAGGRPWPRSAITLAGIALLAGLVLAIPELRHAFERGDPRRLGRGPRQSSTSLGVAGPLLILALALIHAVVFYPAEIVDAAAGFVYGFFPALALVMAGWLLSGFLCYAVGRSVARPLLDRWLGAERFERTEAMIERGGATLLIAVRLIPIVPFSLVCYAAGAARVPPWRFAWTTAVGYLPITALAVYFGTRLEGLEPDRPAGPRQRRGAARAAARRPLDPAPPVAALSADPPPTRLTLKRKVGRGLVDVAGRVDRHHPHHVPAGAEAPDEARRAEVDEAAVDAAGEARARLVGAEAEDGPGPAAAGAQRPCAGLAAEGGARRDGVDREGDRRADADPAGQVFAADGEAVQAVAERIQRREGRGAGAAVRRRRASRRRRPGGWR